VERVSATVRLDDLVSLTEAAKLLASSRQAVHAAWKRGRIAGYQLGNVILLDRRSIDEYKQTKHAGGRPKSTRKKNV
jgi:excisionase family DNA binding protein